MTNYYAKYIKYKLKYNNIKQKGGMKVTLLEKKFEEFFKKAYVFRKNEEFFLN